MKHEIDTITSIPSINHKQRLILVILLAEGGETKQNLEWWCKKLGCTHRQTVSANMNVLVNMFLIKRKKAGPTSSSLYSIRWDKVEKASAEGKRYEAIINDREVMYK